METVGSFFLYLQRLMEDSDSFVDDESMGSFIDDSDESSESHFDSDMSVKSGSDSDDSSQPARRSSRRNRRGSVE